MVSRLVSQVESELNKLSQSGPPPGAKSDMTRAQNLVKDANKSKQVCLFVCLFARSFVHSFIHSFIHPSIHHWINTKRCGQF